MKNIPIPAFVFGLPLMLSVLAPSSLHADVKMPAIFGDHMVLQQDIKIPVWGWAAPDESVNVALGDDTANTTADSAGKWRVDLEPVKTTSTPLTLIIKGKNSLTINDVLVGDVWLCSGQSNMQFNLNGKSFGGRPTMAAANAVAAANDPQLRLFVVSGSAALDPQADVTGTWKVCTPDSATSFSAVGYFFGQELRRTLKRPLGLICASFGGMPAQAFTSLSGLQMDPPFSNYIGAYQNYLASYLKAKETYPADVIAYNAKLQDWNANVAPIFNPLMAQWQAEANKAKTTGLPAPPKPVPSAAMPVAPNLKIIPSTPTVLFNGMIAPLMPYAIKGTIWYQGESNVVNAPEYSTLFPRMISDWRSKWGEGDFPFLFVQLAAFQGGQKNSPEAGWPEVREAQLKTLSLPNTGMAVAIDIGDSGNVHPQDKHDVGLRLALAAKHVAYGQDLVCSGPIYDSMKVEGIKIRLSFKNIGTGLKMATPPWTPNGIPLPVPTELTGFAIAGADKNWVLAQAQVDGNDVLVSSDQVATPVAVRYGWASNPSCNLYNNEGLPASPFRTDDWADSVPVPTPPPASQPTSVPKP